MGGKQDFHIDEKTGKKVFINKDGTISKRTGNPKLFKGMKPLNPNGREKGSVNKMTKLSRALMTEKGPEVVKKIISMALDGDVHCLKMCIDRILPVHKAVDSSKTNNDSKIVINVGTSAGIKDKLANTNPEKLINPPTKSNDEVIIEVAEVVK
jgi:hypothetical protein